MTWFHLKSPPDVCSNFYPIKNFGHFWCSKLKACIDKAKKEVVQVQSAKSDLDQLVNCTLNALDSFSWKSWTLMVFVLKNYFLLSLMFLLNFSIPFVQKQFHIGFHNGWKCRLGITIDVTYRMNSIQKRGGVELLLVSADYSQIEFNCDYLLISSKDSIRHSFQYVVLNLSLNKPLIKGAFFFCSEPLRDHFSFMQYFIWMNFESIHSVSKTLKKSHFHSISYLKM